MSVSLDDPRLPLWTERRDMQSRLALHQIQRQALCGCPQHGGHERLLELAALIRQDIKDIAAMSDLITDGVRINA